MSKPATNGKIIFIFLSLCLSGPLVLANNITMLSIISLVYYFFCVFFIYSVYRKIINIPFVFLTSIYLFHCGQLMVSLFGFGDLIASDIYVLNYLDIETFIISVKFTIFCFFAFTLGVLLSKPNIEHKMGDENKQYIHLSDIKVVGIILFLLSFPCRVYIDINKLLLYMASSYIDTYSLSINGAISIFSNFFIPSLMLLTIAYHRNKTKCRIIIVFAIVYSLFSMLKGNRAQELITIICVLYLYASLVGIKKIKLKNAILLLLGIYFLIVIMNLVGNARTKGNIALSNNLIQAFKESNPITQIMEFFAEMGGTMKSLGYSVRYIPSYHNYMFGFTYIVSFFSIYPNVGGILGNIPNYYSYLNLFPKNVTQYMGGSILGEIYTNFGLFFGVFAMIFIGFLIGTISNSFIRCCYKKDNFYKLAVIATLIPNMFFWSRDFFYTIIFQTFWVAVFIWMAKSIRIRKER